MLNSIYVHEIMRVINSGWNISGICNRRQNRIMVSWAHNMQMMANSCMMHSCITQCSVLILLVWTKNLLAMDLVTCSTNSITFLNIDGQRKNCIVFHWNYPFPLISRNRCKLFVPRFHFVIHFSKFLHMYIDAFYSHHAANWSVNQCLNLATRK